MYRHCIFCTADLGANEALEAFPVGRSLAFDAHRGRLWAVCRRCGRWNLAPLEERWEAVESGERLFRDARLKVHSENVGLAKLPGGTRLIRVGEALGGELAAWRYGTQLRKRRWRYFLGIGAAAATGLALSSGLTAVVGAIGGLSVIDLAFLFYHRPGRNRVLHHLPAEESPTGKALPLRPKHLEDARLLPDESGGLRLRLPHALPTAPRRTPGGEILWSAPPVVLTGDRVRDVVARAMLGVNAPGASRRDLGAALGLLGGAGSAERFLAHAVGREGPLEREQAPGSALVLRRRGGRLRASWVLPEKELGTEASSTATLALEMALHEESERRALEGELKALEAAWREAEEIASIADRLPDVLAPGDDRK